MPHIQRLTFDATDAEQAELMAELRTHFSDAQMVEIGAVIALLRINNRWNELTTTDVEPAVVKFLEEKNYKGSKEARTQEFI